MPLSKFATVKTNDPNLTKIQENINKSVNPLIDIQLLNGNLLQDVSLSSSSVNQIEHKLGRQYQGYLIILKSANANIWQDNSNTLKDKIIKLNTSSNCIASIWIF